MILLDEKMKAYMEKYGWKHVVLKVEEFTS